MSVASVGAYLMMMMLREVYVSSLRWTGKWQLHLWHTSLLETKRVFLSAVSVVWVFVLQAEGETVVYLDRYGFLEAFVGELQAAFAKVLACQCFVVAYSLPYCTLLVLGVVVVGSM